MRQKHPAAAADRRRTRKVPEQTASDTRALSRIRKSLKDASVVKVNVKYLTQDDRVEFIFEPFDRSGKMVRASAVPNGHELEAQCLLCFRVLQKRRYPLWWSAAGGFGVFEWNLIRNTLTHYHHARRIEVKTTRREGF
jgi:hypothetical protein